MRCAEQRGEAIVTLAQAGMPVLLKGLTSKEVSYIRLTQDLDCDA